MAHMMVFRSSGVSLTPDLSHLCVHQPRLIRSTSPPQSLSGSRFYLSRLPRRPRTSLRSSRLSRPRSSRSRRLCHRARLLRRRLRVRPPGPRRISIRPPRRRRPRVLSGQVRRRTSGGRHSASVRPRLRRASWKDSAAGRWLDRVSWARGSGESGSGSVLGS